MEASLRVETATLAICFSALFVGETAAARPAELVLRGGAVYTSNAARSWASAVAVADRKIIYVGDDRGVADYVSRKTRVIELDGKMVLPGLHDSHVHPMSGGLRFLRCNLGAAKTAETISAAVRACAV